jgi:hypothetical protein
VRKAQDADMEGTVAGVKIDFGAGKEILMLHKVEGMI